MMEVNYSDAPEAVAPHDPEVLYEKNPVAIKTADAGVRLRRLGDIKASTFWLLFALISVLVIGVTVGGAVGGSLVVGKNHPVTTVIQSLSTSSVNIMSKMSTATATTTSLPNAITTSTPSSDCAGSNGTAYRSLFLTGTDGVPSSSAGLTFTKICSAGMAGFNLASAYVFTFEDCIEVCASLNFFNGNQNCLSVTFNPTWPRPHNCWVHNFSTWSFNPEGDASVLAV